MNLSTMQDISEQRTIRWHTNGGLEEWSTLEWSAAMCGEAGEAADAGLLLVIAGLTAKAGQATNIAKKIKRLDNNSLSKNDPGREYTHADRTQAQEDFMMELADVCIYAMACASRVGGSLEEAIRIKFNKTSERYGFPERL